MSLCCLGCQRSLRRADHLSRGILQNVVRRCVRYINLVNEEVLAHSVTVARTRKLKGQFNYARLDCTINKAVSFVNMILASRV
jgi:hypothetical protein